MYEILLHVCSTGDIRSKSVHVSINRNVLKDVMNETNDSETSVTDNPFINAPIYFELFDCGKIFLKNIDATCEQAYMSTPQGKYDT